MRGMMWDLILLVLLVNLKMFLVRIGLWQYVRTDDDVHITPRFRNKNKELRDKNLPKEEAESYFQKIKWQTYWFLVKLLPNYRYRGG